MRVLIVDDESDVRDLLVRALARDGHTVSGAASIAEAEAALHGGDVDVVVLDLGLGDGNGMNLCRRLRARGVSAAILIVTAQSEVGRRVEGLDAGADDFLAKPFALAELRARVRALGRRRTERSPVVFERDGLTLDVGARRAVRKDVPLAITAREWAILEALATRAGRVVPRATILEEVWGSADESTAASLEVLVARIRRKLGPSWIETLRGEGYALAAKA